MALFYTRGWVSTKGTHANNFTAGQDLLEFTWVKETFDGSNIVVEALPGDVFLGFVIQPKGALFGEKVDILLGEWRFNGGSSSSEVAVVPGCPTVTDDTNAGFFVGSLWFDTTRQSLYVCVDPTAGAAIWVPETHFHLDTVAPTVNDDVTNCYFNGFYWYDTVLGQFWLCIDDTAGAAVWVQITGITDVVIGNTLHVAVNGNDGTALPDSLVNKYLTIQAAHAASGPTDTIIIWPGTYTLPSSLAIDGTTATRFYAHTGVAIITPPIGNPAFNISPSVNFTFHGNAVFLVRSDIFKNISPLDDICRIDFQADICGQFGVTGFIGDITSMRGHIKVNTATDLAILCEGWCDIEFAINKCEFTGAAIMRIGNISDNNGLTYNTTYGTSRFQLTGRDSRYAYISGAYGPGFGEGVFTSGVGGTRNDRKVKICADVYAFDAAGFNINEGTWTWEGSGYADKDPLPTNDLYPFLLFNNTENVDFYFEHKMGSINSDLDNTILHMLNNGTVKLAGNYYSLSETYPLIKFDQAPLAGSRLILSGNYKTAGAIHVMEFNDLGLATPFLPVFGEATVECLDSTVFIESTSGIPMNIYVEHSLVTRTNYNAVIFTDLSVGNRHYVDRNFTNYIPNEHLR